MEQHHMQEDHNMNAPYGGFYSEQDPGFIGYGAPQISNNFQVHATRNHLAELQQHQPGMGSYQHLSLIPPHQYTGPVYGTSSPPPHGSMSISASPPPPPSPEVYDPLSPAVSGSDTSADGLYHHSNSSGANSPSSSRANSLVHRHGRYHPTPSPTSSSGRRRSRSRDSDDENDMGSAFVENLAHSRKEATRRQRIEAEQRRRDELRDGYAKLKDVLPVSNQKSSKVSLLERATNYIIQLEKNNAEMQARLAELDVEMTRLRATNESISLSSGHTPSSALAGTPGPEGTPGPTTHSLTSVKGQEPPSEDSSPSTSAAPSEAGF
jgi:hypothetical protein